MTNGVLISVVSWTHDFGAALFLVCAYITWLILRLTADKESDSGIAGRLLRHLAILHWVSFVAVMVFGVFRLHFFMQEAGDGSSGEFPILVGKHVFFTVLLIIGFIQYSRAKTWQEKNK